MDPGRVPAVEAAVLVAGSTAPWAVLYMPRLMIEQAGRDAYWAALPLTLGSLLLGYVMVLLYRRFPGRSLVGVACEVIGRLPGLVLATLYGFALISLAAVALRVSSEVIINVTLPRTPIPVVLASLLVVCAFNVRGGIEVMARANLALAPFGLAVPAVLLAFSVRDISSENLKPLLENGLAPVLRGTYVAAGFFASSTLALATVLPHLNRHDQATRTVAWGVGLTGWLGFIATFHFVGVMGPEIAARLRFLPVEVARFISIAEFLERMEALAVIWGVMGAFANVSLWYYAAATTLAEVAGLGDYRPLVWPVGFLVGEGAVLFFRNVADMIAFLRDASTPYLLLLELAVPVGLLALSAARRGRLRGAPGSAR